MNLVDLLFLVFATLSVGGRLAHGFFPVTPFRPLFS